MLVCHVLRDLTCASLTSMLTHLFVSVSVIHRYVGNVASEAMDPCWGPWTWRPGELCGTPLNTATTVAIMSSTALNQPLITQDYTYLFEKEGSKRAWNTMRESLKALQPTIDERNKKRKRPFLLLEIDRIETTISI